MSSGRLAARPGRPHRVPAFYLTSKPGPRASAASRATGGSCRCLTTRTTAAQVVPLLPAAKTCAALITSRRQNSDLAEPSGWKWAKLPGPEGAHPARRPLLTWPGLAGEPQAPPALLCGLLRGTAARPAHRRHRAWVPVGARVQTIAARLADPRCCSTSYRSGILPHAPVSRPATRCSRTPPPSPPSVPSACSAWRPARILACTAAALLDTSRDHSERTLETLVDVHLLETPAPGRYRFHDLIRLYAAERADEEEWRPGAARRCSACWPARRHRGRRRPAHVASRHWRPEGPGTWGRPQ